MIDEPLRPPWQIDWTKQAQHDFQSKKRTSTITYFFGSTAKSATIGCGLVGQHAPSFPPGRLGHRAGVGPARVGTAQER
ncbi:hypothetical protein EDD95_0704 [Streptomyces sp. CEV 2-1]|uniref:hypothetical protein n=1 Tax=Streptomyces sp. CEV 2-1 TaxID=2485153 RepID=UPI000F49255A|nr:hypothetical protein [Streptomyces sp. CEV 2-1]ROQ81153.1 hypothetical protein EDD95_0704 [Streptomyces sp. CEV 2-1]